jgi:hypothetical protein
MSDRIPTIGAYRGVPLHDFQDDDRINDVVKPGIDAVHALNDAESLYDYACNFRHSAEARLFAAAKVKAIFETRAGSHEHRGNVDMDMLRARTSSLDSLIWTDTCRYFGGLCDATARAPGVLQTIEQRPGHHIRRLREAQEKAREGRSVHRREPVAVVD